MMSGEKENYKTNKNITMVSITMERYEENFISFKDLKLISDIYPLIKKKNLSVYLNGKEMKEK